MTKLKDKVEQWKITVVGVDRRNNNIVGGNASITRDALECVLEDFKIEEHEFKMLWRTVMECAEKDESEFEVKND